MQLLRWNNPGHETTRASSMLRGAGCREPTPRLRRREKNVLDIPLYRSGHYTQNPIPRSQPPAPGRPPRPKSTSARHIIFFNDTATTEIYTLSLHDALPI